VDDSIPCFSAKFKQKICSVCEHSENKTPVPLLGGSEIVRAYFQDKNEVRDGGFFFFSCFLFLFLYLFVSFWFFFFASLYSFLFLFFFSVSLWKTAGWKNVWKIRANVRCRVNNTIRTDVLIGTGCGKQGCGKRMDAPGFPQVKKQKPPWWQLLSELHIRLAEVDFR